ncbi:helix-turn-helix domain-containing protein [Streptomyces sp. NBC_01267]|uniref:helix-turn-helix domain-containing protein n=1 Tax=Streptomyces sp. NBC_01267 TaxID=2903805 RepID=UPI002E342EDE|nr:helix-turn-helix domain-containing protein [Streptomyces sp. NBC_01267]
MTDLPPPKERRRLREAKSLSVKQLAATIGVTPATVRSWESGRTSPEGHRHAAYAKVLAHGPTPQPVREPVPQPVREPVPQPALLPEPESAPASASEPEPESASTSASEPASASVAESQPAPGNRDEPRPLHDATPAEAFDLLYARAAPRLVHQTYALTGRRHLAAESVERAFHLAWQRWPEVATDRDPAGWVRAAAYEYALSPWHRLRRSHKRLDRQPADPDQGPLRDAVLGLPPAYRRTLLLYDGLGLDLPDTAAETEASTPATANRLLYARAAVAEQVPELADPELLQERLAALTSTGPEVKLPEARVVRTGSEHRIRFWTRLTAGFVVLLTASTGYTLATAPTYYARPTGAPHRVEGVPPRGGPQRLTAEDVKLRQKLRTEPANGPGRLVPSTD